MIKRYYLSLLILLISSFSSSSQISLVSFSTGYASPVDIKSCGDDRLFIVERDGIIQISDTNGVKKSTPFLDIHTRVLGGGEQGLLGLAFPSDFLTSGYFYVNYTEINSGDTRISRFYVDSLTPDSADPSSEEILLTIYQPYSNHNGGHIAFGPDGYLYIGMGDGGSGGDPQNRAQNPDSLLGKMLRIAVDPSIPGYTIPPTNPFASDSTLGRGEIYALGVRNPWRFSFDPMTGDLWIGDVGQGQYEEIDFEPIGSAPGSNFGWRCYEGNQVYNATGCLPISNYVMPVYQYQHSGGRCSLTGGYIYRAAKHQELYGKYFYADYCVSDLQYLESNGNGGFSNTNLGSLGPDFVSTFGTDSKGEIYCAAINNGTIYKIVSADCSPVATINSGNDTIDDCATASVNLYVPHSADHDYVWTLNDDTLSTTNTLNAVMEGMYIVQVTNQNCSNSDTVFVDFTTPLNVTFAGLDTLYCVYHSVVNLLPNYLGGTFTGQGISGATFNPALAGIGDWVITYTYTSNAGCTASHSQDVRVDACAGVAENHLLNSIIISPNPANGGEFNIHAYTTTEKSIKMEILDVTGRVVMNENIVLNVGYNSYTEQIDLAKGIYIIRFTDEIASVSMKLIMQQ